MTDSDELTSSSRPPVFYSVSSYIVDPVIYRYSMGGATDNGANMIIDLQNDNDFNPNMLQTLSYNLCYLYAFVLCTFSCLVTKRAKLHARGGSFSDTEPEEGAGGAAVTFGVVKPELQRVQKCKWGDLPGGIIIL
ncbi:unnamed protein product [Rhizophagus irregularis]|nr:unnamed protein product [Rhizophagus irregularis]